MGCKGMGDALRSSLGLDETEQKAGNGQYGEHDKQNLADGNGAGGDAAKAEDGCNQGDNEEDDSVVQLWNSSWFDDALSVAAGLGLTHRPDRRPDVGQTGASA